MLRRPKSWGGATGSGRDGRPTPSRRRHTASTSALKAYNVRERLEARRALCRDFLARFEAVPEYWDDLLECCVEAYVDMLSEHALAADFKELDLAALEQSIRRRLGKDVPELGGFVELFHAFVLKGQKKQLSDETDVSHPLFDWMTEQMGTPSVSRTPPSSSRAGILDGASLDSEEAFRRAFGGGSPMSLSLPLSVDRSGAAGRELTPVDARGAAGALEAASTEAQGASTPGAKPRDAKTPASSDWFRTALGGAMGVLSPIPGLGSAARAVAGVPAMPPSAERVRYPRREALESEAPSEPLINVREHVGQYENYYIGTSTMHSLPKLRRMRKLVRLCQEAYEAILGTQARRSDFLAIDCETLTEQVSQKLTRDDAALSSDISFIHFLICAALPTTQHPVQRRVDADVKRKRLLARRRMIPAPRTTFSVRDHLLACQRDCHALISRLGVTEAGLRDVVGHCINAYEVVLGPLVTKTAFQKLDLDTLIEHMPPRLRVAFPKLPDYLVAIHHLCCEALDIRETRERRDSDRKRRRVLELGRQRRAQPDTSVGVREHLMLCQRSHQDLLEEHGLLDSDLTIMMDLCVKGYEALLGSRARADQFHNMDLSKLCVWIRERLRSDFDGLPSYLESVHRLVCEHLPRHSRLPRRRRAAAAKRRLTFKRGFAAMSRAQPLNQWLRHFAPEHEPEVPAEDTVASYEFDAQALKATLIHARVDALDLDAISLDRLSAFVDGALQPFSDPQYVAKLTLENRYHLLWGDYIPLERFIQVDTQVIACWVSSDLTDPSCRLLIDLHEGLRAAFRRLVEMGGTSHSPHSSGTSTPVEGLLSAVALGEDAWIHLGTAGYPMAVLDVYQYLWGQQVPREVLRQLPSKVIKKAALTMSTETAPEQALAVERQHQQIVDRMRQAHQAGSDVRVEAVEHRAPLHAKRPSAPRPLPAVPSGRKQVPSRRTPYLLIGLSSVWAAVGLAATIPYAMVTFHMTPAPWLLAHWTMFDLMASCVMGGMCFLFAAASLAMCMRRLHVPQLEPSGVSAESAKARSLGSPSSATPRQPGCEPRSLSVGPRSSRG